MEHLWSPWRYQYVSAAGAVPRGKDHCLFCRVAAGTQEDAANLVVLRAERSFILLNRYPYSTGHLMIAPYAHVATLEQADEATLEELMRLARRCETALRQVYRPDGLNFGFNIGHAAGAGIAEHIHMHGLPRWAGDTSFITTVAETRVLPEDLETTCGKLKAALGGPVPYEAAPGRADLEGTAVDATHPPRTVVDGEASKSTPPRPPTSCVAAPAPNFAGNADAGERDVDDPANDNREAMDNR